MHRTKAIQDAYRFLPTDTPAQINEKKAAMLKAGQEFKNEHGDKSPQDLRGASEMHKTAIQIINSMGGKFKIESYGFFLELYGVKEPEIMYHVIDTVIRCHDNDQS